MRKLLYLNEFAKRINKAEELEHIALLSAFMCKKIFKAEFFVFFMKENDSIQPLYIDSNTKKLDFNLLLSYQSIINNDKNGSFLYNIKDIHSKSPLHGLLRAYSLDSIIVQAFAYFEEINVFFGFAGRSYTIEDCDYFESFSNVIKLKLDYVFSMQKLHKVIKDKESIFNNSLTVLSNLAEIRDVYTKGHMQRVAFYAKNIALNLGLKNIDIIYRSALLHDIGKVGIPDTILLKPAKLSNQEYNFIKKHPGFSEFILSQITGFEDIVKIIRSHHEYLDGTGYPDGLRGDEISVEVRIITIADIFDAITIDRPYRKSLNCKDALDLISKEFKDKIDMNILERSKEVLIESQRMFQNMESYNSQFEDMRNMVFFIDYETGFYSKHYLPKFLYRLNKKGKLLLLDLQDMRTINFTYSRSVGDNLIIKFSQFIREVFQDEYEFFRIGGDSFVVVIFDDLPNISSYIFELDNKLKSAFRSINPSFWFAFCDLNVDDDINKCLEDLTRKIFHKRRVS